MSELTGTALLRAAATRCRELDQAATRAPWRVCAEGSEGSRIAPTTGDLRERSRFIGIMNGRVQPEDGANARYTAAFRAVAAPLADWLDLAAEFLEAFDDSPDHFVTRLGGREHASRADGRPGHPRRRAGPMTTTQRPDPPSYQLTHGCAWTPHPAGDIWRVDTSRRCVDGTGGRWVEDGAVWYYWESSQ